MSFPRAVKFWRRITGVVRWKYSPLESISNVHPLYFLSIYLLAIPLFALFYVYLPGAFYAPYARLEQSALGDERRVVSAIEAVVRTNLSSLEERREKQADDDANAWRVVPENTIAIHADIQDNELDVVFSVDLDTRQVGLFARLPVVVTVYRRILEGSNDAYIHVDYDVNKITAAPLREYLNKYNVFAGMTIGQFNYDDRMRIANFVDGYAGDPTFFTNSYWRMLYFSVIVITTVGFGDIVPMTNYARVAVALEAITGILLIGLFLNSITARRSKY